MSEFLAETNPCGQSLLQLTARGNAVIAELLRLADHIPPVFHLATKAEVKKYKPIIHDFEYLRNKAVIEHKIRKDPSLLDLDEEFPEQFLPILERFYQMFESIVIYIQALNQFYESLVDGVFIQYSVERILQEKDGKQLLCESVYLYGVMLLLLDMNIPGIVRERLIVSYSRYNGGVEIPHWEEVCELCRRTRFVSLDEGFRKGYPTEYFQRFSPDPELVKMVLGKLRSDDIYTNALNYPDPDHRSTAMARQAEMVFVSLFFAPEYLHRNGNVMREVIDRHFSDNWVVSIYLGHTIDLSVAWDSFKAARTALKSVIQGSNVRELHETMAALFRDSAREIRELQIKGTLSQDFVLQNCPRCLQIVRRANVALRWFILQERSASRKTQEFAMGGITRERILEHLMNTSDVEFSLDRILTNVITNKASSWGVLKDQAVKQVAELAQFFAVGSTFSSVRPNEHLHQYLKDLSTDISNLNLDDQIVTGREISDYSSALENMHRFDDMQSSLIRQLLADAKGTLGAMLRLLNVADNQLFTLTVISDFDYAWKTMGVYVPLMQSLIRDQPSSAVKLRALFLKLSNLVQKPLLRINQSDSGDLESVMHYYSSLIVLFVQDILQIMPRTMFQHLEEISTTFARMEPIPTRVPRNELLHYAQLDQRKIIERATHRICELAKGILAMKTTFVGSIKMDPKEMLTNGIRKEMVLHVASYLDSLLVFPKSNPESLLEGLRQVSLKLRGLEESLEYIQDYVGIYGVRLWGQEFQRVMNHYVEQECAMFLKRSGDTWTAQSDIDSFEEVAPIPNFAPRDSRSRNWVGRVINVILDMLESRKAVYVHNQMAWVDRDSGSVLFGLEMVRHLAEALGVAGLVGLDRYLSFVCVQMLQKTLGQFNRLCDSATTEVLSSNIRSLYPATQLVDNAKLYNHISRNISDFYDTCISNFLRIGRAQLLRNLFSFHLKMTASLDSTALFGALKTTNISLLSDIHEHYRDPDQNPYPTTPAPPPASGDAPDDSDDDDHESLLMVQLSDLLVRVGLDDPFSTIYVTPPVLPFVPFICFGIWLNSQSHLELMPSFRTFVWDLRGQHNLDGSALAVGLKTILHQFHPMYLERFVALASQYIRSLFHIKLPLPQLMKDPSKMVMPVEVLNLLRLFYLWDDFGVFDLESLSHFIPLPVLCRSL